MHHIILLFYQADSFFGGGAFVEWSKSEPPVFLRTPHTPPRNNPRSTVARTDVPAAARARRRRLRPDAVETIFSGVCGSGGGVGGGSEVVDNCS